MENNYGVFTGSIEGCTDQWVKIQDPLELTDEGETEGCIDTLSEDAAETMAGELGEGFAPGRPKRRPIIH